jgi:hypothetical protein
MDERTTAGSIQAVSNYVRAGEGSGHTIRLYGRENPNFPHVQFSTDLEAFDYVVFIIESGLRWMSGLRIPRILSRVSRERRAILDTDGMYNQKVTVDGYDRNYADEEERTKWMAYYHLLADKIMQPTFTPLEPRVKALPFYGYDPSSEINAKDSPPKQFDIMLVGHNWWRWREVSNRLLPAIEEICAHIDSICFVGSWWNAPPASYDPGLEAAFGFDNERFKRLRIQVKPAVPFTEVIRAMSMGRVNLMTQRPLLRRLKLLTSKYFEVLSADTIPLVMLDPDHAELIYGRGGRELALHDGIANKLIDALNQPYKYREIVQEVRRHLIKYHSYCVRVQELVTALQV